MKNSSKIVCRFAPSPTGLLHVGGVRSALFNFLFAKQNRGRLILRIEDTDKERSKREYEEDIVNGFNWLGLAFDNTYRQSDRLHIYKEKLKELIGKNLAYKSKEKTEEGKRDEVIRFRNPNKKIKFQDLIKGEIEFDTTELGDFVIAKSEDEPLYHLAVVVDDIEMGITHVIRGEDHISNTPRQILIQEAVGAQRPEYAHIPLILAPDKSKLSKRKHGKTVSLGHYIEQDYLPEAILNYLALLGWNPGSDREFFSLSELVEHFSIERVQKGGAVFDVQKLNWLNKQHLVSRSKKEVLKKISEYLASLPNFKKLSSEQEKKLEEMVLERISYYGEVKEFLSSGELDYFTTAPALKIQELPWKEERDLSRTKMLLQACADIIQNLHESPSQQETKNALFPYAEKEGKGSVLWPLRYSLTGRIKSPDPFTVISILGREESIRRIKTAADLLK